MFVFPLSSSIVATASKLSGAYKESETTVRRCSISVHIKQAKLKNVQLLIVRYIHIDLDSTQKH